MIADTGVESRVAGQSAGTGDRVQGAGTKTQMSIYAFAARLKSLLKNAFVVCEVAQELKSLRENLG